MFAQSFENSQSANRKRARSLLPAAFSCALLLSSTSHGLAATPAELDTLENYLTQLHVSLGSGKSLGNDLMFRNLLAQTRLAASKLDSNSQAPDMLRESLNRDLTQIERLVNASVGDGHNQGSISTLARRKVSLLLEKTRARRTDNSTAGGVSSYNRQLQANSQQTPFYSKLAGAGAIVFCVMLWRRRRQKRDQSTASQSMLDELPDAIAMFNPKGQLTALNRKLSKLLPLEIETSTFINTTSSDLYAQLSPDNLAIERARNQAREEAENPDATISFEVPSYGSRALLVKERQTTDGGTAISVYSSYKPVTTRLSDPLTALPNRAKLVSELANRCSRTKDEIALIIVDLRSFRQINDTYGRETGDELLKQTGICLQHCMPEDALIARTAGDEFAVLLEFNNDRAQIEHRVTRFLATLRHGLNIKAINVPVRASVGIAFAPEHGNTVSALLNCADSACAHAKQLGNNTMVVYNSAQQVESKRRHQLEVALQQAIPKNELALQYQPQIDILSTMTCGMEALLRWNNPEFGRVSPVEFITIAEQSGIIKPIGAWVLQQSINDYQRLSQFGMSPPTLSVNLSRKQFDDGLIVQDVAAVLEKTGFDPDCLCLEITETAIFRDSDAMKTMLHDLRGLGVKLAIDDFGVGFSSLLELRDYPINEIKIDRAFVMDVTTNSQSQDIIRAIVDIADSIGADVVAEGIENQQQLDAVASLGCHRAQGYYVCEPMAATTFPDLVLSA